MTNNYEELLKLYDTILDLLTKTKNEFGEQTPAYKHFLRFENLVRDELNTLFDSRYSQEEELKNVNKVLEDGYLDPEQREYLLTLRNNLQTEIYRKTYKDIDIAGFIKEDGEENDN